MYTSGATAHLLPKHNLATLPKPPSVRTGGEKMRLAGISNRLTPERRTKDPLTGLLNRTSLCSRLQRRIEDASLRSRSFALLVIDIDGFPRISDSLGTRAADELLVEVARRMAQTIYGVRGTVVARLRTNEFALVIDDVAAMEDAQTYARFLQYLLGRPITCGSQQVCISISIGIAFAESRSYSNAVDMLEDADVALHRAKSCGKAQCITFNKQMREEAAARLRLESDLGVALELGQFEVYYQPKVRLCDGSVKGFEALIRWRHPQRGFVSPFQFIPIAEETGLISEIGRWVAVQAIKQLADWRSRGVIAPNATMAINISTQEFLADDLLDFLKQELSLAGVPLSSFVLEVTEGVLLEDSLCFVEKLKEIVSSGMGLDLDDFGTGYSSLSYLHRFPFRSLKIDQSFVRRMTTDPQSVKLVAAIVGLAKSMNLKVIAEGVETAEQADTLRLMKCAVAQGYLFSRPLAPQDLEPFLLATKLQTEAPAEKRSPRAPRQNPRSKVSGLALAALAS